MQFRVTLTDTTRMGRLTRRVPDGHEPSPWLARTLTVAAATKSLTVAAATWATGTGRRPAW